MKYIKLLNSNEEKQEFEQMIDYCPIVTLTEQEDEDIINYYDKDDIVMKLEFPLTITYNSSSNYTDLFNTLKSYIEDNCVNTAPEGFYQYELTVNTGDIILSKNSKTYNISCVMLGHYNTFYILLYETKDNYPYWEITEAGKISEID